MHLTEIARALGGKIPLKKAHNRLSQQLGRENLGRKVLNGLRRMGAERMEKKTRDLIYRGREHSLLELALTWPLPYAERIVKEEKGKETIRFVKLSYNLEDIRLLTCVSIFSGVIRA